eukprot:COSAG05_NODE_474_length_9484_cov_8.277784_4_plen_51_part_00
MLQSTVGESWYRLPDDLRSDECSVMVDLLELTWCTAVSVLSLSRTLEPRH